MGNREDINRAIPSESLIMMPDGSEVPLDLSNPKSMESLLRDVGDDNLAAYVKAGEMKGQNRNEAPSIAAMQRLELVGYESSSDSGHFRLYPKGHLIFDLLREWAGEIALNRLGAMQIDSPVIYDWSDPEIREQAGSFHENHYIVKVPDDPDKEFILRFAGDFGLFKMMKQAALSYRVLPLRVYEFSKSFRYERSGALSGLKRLRAFHMPDVHCFCRDIDQGWDEYALLYRNYADLADRAEVSYAVCFRIVKDFYDRYKPNIVDLLKHSQRPAFIEVLSEMKHYWAIKHEFQAIDSVGGCVQLATVQLDIKDADLYGIRYVDADGGKKACSICHSSIGSIERWIYAVLEEALKKQRPVLPLWLAPSQLRIVPVSHEHLEYCAKIDIPGIRMDLDDSDESLGRKIARAGKEWVPYVGVVGKKEISSGSLMVSNRFDGGRAAMPIARLEEIIKDQCRGLPWKPLSLPKLLSRRPVFHG